MQVLREEFEYFCKCRCKYKNEKEVFIEEIYEEYVKCPECAGVSWNEDRCEGIIVICEYCALEDFISMVELEGKIK